MKIDRLLITGGTGTLGQALVRELLQRTDVNQIVVFSRDECKQQQLAQLYPDEERLRFFIGDVRDLRRLRLGFKGVDYVIHAAALKQVPSCEYNPFEVIQTNVLGAQNVIEAALESDVKKVIALSTDKATSPINLYGATKLCSDKLFTASNSYSGNFGAKFSVIRYGNVVGSRGSVIPFFLSKRKEGVLPITSVDMTRFWLSSKQAANLVLHALEKCFGGEILVPKIPSMKIVDVAKAIAPECELQITAIRPGEKLHETMISKDDAANAFEVGDYYIIAPSSNLDRLKERVLGSGAVTLPERFEYSSDNNERWLDIPAFQQLLNEEIAYSPFLSEFANSK